MEEDNVRKVEINVHDGGLVNIANDNGIISTAQNNNEGTKVKWKLFKLNKKMVNLGLLLIISAIVVWKIVYLGENGIISKLVCEESIITPIYYYEIMQDYDAKEFADECTEERWDYGCMLNVYLSNKMNTPVTISKTSIIIDDIIKSQQSEVYIIGIYSESDNELALYAINNGTGKLDSGEIHFRINHFIYDEENNSSKYLSEDQITSLLGEKGIIKINDLAGGEIRKIANYNLNKSFIKDLELLCISYEIIENNDQRIDDVIGLIGFNDIGIFFSYSEGDYLDTIVERSLSIDVDKDKGRELRVPANFIIDEYNVKNVFYVLYPTSSCELTFHAKLKCAGEKRYIETEKFTQKIYVPLYKEEGGFFDSVREFIKKYDIDTYYYNSNPIIQKEIDYVPMQSSDEY